MIFKKLLHFWNKTEEVFLVFGMSTMFIAMIAQVVCRYCFNSPLIWSEVYARYMYMWVVFLGISYGFRHDKHIYVGILYDRFPEKIKQTVHILICALMIYIMAVQIPCGVEYCQQLMRVKVNGLPIARGIVYWCLPIGYTTAIIRLLMDVVSTVLQMFGIRIGENTEMEDGI